MDTFAKWVLVGALANATGCLITYFTEAKTEQSYRDLVSGLIPFGGFFVVILLTIFLTIRYVLTRKS